MSISIDELYQKLLDSGISEAELEKQVQHKESEFGGFMSKQGILFIIAKENGIYVQSPDVNEQMYDGFENEIDYDEFSINISELKEEMRKIVLLGKIIKVFEPREFTRKDGTIGKVVSFLFGDGSQEIKIILWDDKVDIIKNEYFRVGDLLRIIGAYCKKGKNGNLEVHLGKRGKIVLSPDITDKKLKIRLENFKVDIPSERNSKIKLSSKIKELVDGFNYITRIQGQIQIEVFKEITKKTGEKTFLLKLLLSDDSASIRVLIWGMNAIECLKTISDSDTVVISNVLVKQNKYANEKELVFTKNSSLELVE
ncbi:MAG: hypothetical protein HWN79_02995 [Candidatus Lokiarchaeota archaeon]|nr:hypothetical protein [Candidatus Lokiarchaeota archaeon]